MNRVPWSIPDLSLGIDDDNGDHEFLQNLIDGKTFVPVSITYVSGAIYQGTGQVVGEVAASSQSATASVSLMGSGQLTKQ